MSIEKIRSSENIMLQPYEKLSQFYQEDWGQFSLKYIGILKYLISKYNISPQSILDISCGTGNLIGNLALRYEVVGSDLSESMIKCAKENYPTIPFYVSDMAELHIDKKFDIIISAFDSMNYLVDDNHISAALKNIYGLLTDDGLFVFDINTPILCELKHKGIIERNVNGNHFRQILSYDKEKQIATTLFDFGNDEKEKHIQRAYTYKEILKYLSDNNFKLLQTIDIFTNQEMTDKSEKLLFVTRK